MPIGAPVQISARALPAVAIAPIIPSGRDISRLLQSQPHLMTFSFLFWLIAPLLLLIALVDLATMSTDRRVLLLRRSGLSQSAIASRLGVTRYRVRQALA